MAASEDFPTHLSSLLNNPKMVRIVAGKGREQKTFGVHRDLLLYSCPHAEDELDESFQKGHGEQLKYEEDDPLVWQVLIAWLYTREIHLPPVKPGPNTLERVFPKKDDDNGPVLSAGDFNDAQLQYLAGALTWILADEMRLRDMKNDVINRLYKILEEMPRKDLPALTVVVKEIRCMIYDDRRLYDFHIWYATTSMSAEDLSLQNFPENFLPEKFYRHSLRALALRRVQGKAYSTPPKFCRKFHDHAHSVDGGKACTAPIDLGKVTRRPGDGMTEASTGMHTEG